MCKDAREPVAPETGGRRVSRAGSSRLSPRLSLLLIGGLACGGLACMCLLVAGLAIWRAG